ncbi:aminotransferase class I/II-fold pyridoxal phosphate-dependent enzyme [Cardiobacteriaceae bacterium TAE3-ERU3]|nr:aminotransferase class I/II-fold pyridoxal phosphate-dependent enzyme [Cardiobacteriaceae bacterium TAE3-ERU3]
MYKMMQNTLDALQQSGQLRTLPEAVQGLDLCSNDYLGIARDTARYSAFVQRWLDEESAASSASASRLLGGAAQAAALVEETAARVFSRPALYLNSGYHANIGLLPILAGKGDLIVADKDIHASLIDGARLSAARLLRYPHQDLQALHKLLARHRGEYRHVWLVSESVFSMDGSVSDLPALLALKEEFAAHLYIDEAHAVGIFGDGLGIAHEQGVAQDVDVLVMPCAKALASYGALVLLDEVTRRYVVNHCRSLIFASALPPMVAAWTAQILALLPEFAAARQRLFANTLAMQGALGISTTTARPAPIVPLVIGDNARTMQLAAALRDDGIAVGAVRYPTVPKGMAQLRLCVNADLTADNIARVGERIAVQRRALGA